MNLSQLEYLDAVVRLGGVRRAAAALHVTPQAVSVAIKKLESELDVELIDRAGREIVPTSEGREFARRAQDVLNQIDGLRHFANQDARGVSPDGHFRLYVPCLHGRGELFSDDCYDKFVEEHPEIHLDVWHQPSAACFESLMMGISDAAVSFEEPRDDSLNYKNLGEKSLKVLSCSEQPSLSRSIRIEDLFDGRVAVPINLGPCLTALSKCPETQLHDLKFRDVEYSNLEQCRFLSSGGRILAFSGSQICAESSSILELDINASKELYLPVYFCFRKNEWTERHRTVFWHLMKTLCDIR